MPEPSEEVRYLAKLVHREHLAREDVGPLIPRLEAGEDLDTLLASELGLVTHADAVTVLSEAATLSFFRGAAARLATATA